MSRKVLWELRVNCSLEAEDAMTVALEKLLAAPATIFVDEETQARQVRLYLPRNPLASASERVALQQALRTLRAAGLDPGRATPAVRRLRQEDWAESWKSHFHPLRIGSKLLIKPTWSRCWPAKGQAVVRLDPGLAFGTGQHPTTAFCLEQIASFRQPGTSQSLLDVGTGTGILAIAAAKLGYAPIEAFDNDPACIRIARANARRNRVLDRIRFSKKDLMILSAETPRRYRLLCANLVCDLLLGKRDQLLARLAPNGRLVLAGIFKSQFAAIRRAYAQSGLRLVAHQVEQEWTSGAFE